MERHILDLETLLRIPYVEPYTGFDTSPDGAQVAFSWNPTGQWEVYLMPLHGSVPPRQITTGPGGKFNPRWSPNGRQLAYVLDLDGGELFDIYAYDFAADRHTNLTPGTSDAIQPNFCWSPNGSQIAFISDRSGCFDTYVMPATGGPSASSGQAPSATPFDYAQDKPRAGPARLVLSQPHPDWEVRWSPDGRWLAVVTEAVAQDYWTSIVPVEGDEPRPITDGDDPIPASDACWSPDSTRVAFTSNRDGLYYVGIYEPAIDQITWATEGDEKEREYLDWSPDGRWLVYVVSHGPTTALTLLNLEDGSLTEYQVKPGVHYRPCFAPDGEHLVFVFDNPRHPCDLWVLSLNSGSFRQLTHSLAPDPRGSPFVMPTEVRYPSLDGQSVPALLYQPRQVDESSPAVVYIHGGPTWLTQVTWDPLVQHMVSRGWVVLAPNYRGSTGYGREWQLADRFDLGGGDTKDVVAGADYLAREGLADPDRIAVTGTSWGGYLTMTSLTQYPDRWAAGSAVVPFLNWFTGHANSREDLQHWDLENFGAPEKDYDLYYERSPFFFLDRVAAPVQMICGAHDVRCPASESIQAHDALVAQEKECDLVLYEDEGHGFLKTENVVDAKKRRVAFLARNLEVEDEAKNDA